MRLLIRKPARTADDALAHRVLPHRSVPVHLHDNAVGEPVFLRSEAAKDIGEPLGQHGNDFIDQVDTRPPFVGLAVQCAPGPDIVADVGNMNSESKAVLRQRLYRNGVVKILRIDGIYRHTGSRSQVPASAKVGVRDAVRERSGFLLDLCGKFHRQSETTGDAQDFGMGIPCPAKDFHHSPFRVEMLILPGFELHDDLVARFGRSEILTVDVHIPGKAGVVRNYDQETSPLLQCSRDSDVCAIEDFHHLPLQRAVLLAATEAARQRDDGHPVAVQRGVHKSLRDLDLLRSVLGADGSPAAPDSLKSPDDRLATLLFRTGRPLARVGNPPLGVAQEDALLDQRPDGVPRLAVLLIPMDAEGLHEVLEPDGFSGTLCKRLQDLLFCHWLLRLE